MDPLLANRLYEYVSKKWFMFASPVLSNAPKEGTKTRGLPISCFLTYVPDTLEGLIEHSSELRWLSVMGGGVGGHWRDVRTVSDIAPGSDSFPTHGRCRHDCISTRENAQRVIRGISGRFASGHYRVLEHPYSYG